MIVWARRLVCAWCGHSQSDYNLIWSLWEWQQLVFLLSGCLLHRHFPVLGTGVSDGTGCHPPGVNGRHEILHYSTVAQTLSAEGWYHLELYIIIFHTNCFNCYSFCNSINKDGDVLWSSFHTKSSADVSVDDFWRKVFFLIQLSHYRHVVKVLCFGKKSS